MNGSTVSGPPDLFGFDRSWWDQGRLHVAGVDEVGRGCLAGPVVACAIVLPPYERIPGVMDSKALSPAARLRLCEIILRKAKAVAVAEVQAEEIDRINIRNASIEAMRQAIEGLCLTPDLVLVDGNALVDHPAPQVTVVGGDGRSQSIAAASIVAKVHRDRIMEGYDHRYPGYGFARHKGYPTRAHREAIRRLGVLPIHRRTFRGVADVC